MGLKAERRRLSPAFPQHLRIFMRHYTTSLVLKHQSKSSVAFPLLFPNISASSRDIRQACWSSGNSHGVVSHFPYFSTISPHFHEIFDERIGPQASVKESYPLLFPNISASSFDELVGAPATVMESKEQIHLA